MKEDERVQADKVVEIMATSKTIEEWVQNCEFVKSHWGGSYPPFWYEAIGDSQVAKQTFLKFGYYPNEETL